MTTVKLGGYFFDIGAARKLCEALGISADEVPDFRLERPINNWLVDQNRLDILAAWTKWPKKQNPPAPHPDAKPGIVMCTKFWNVREDKPGPDKPEDEKDLKVKRWLIENGVSKLEWVCFLDLEAITRISAYPRKLPVNPPIGKTVTLEECLRISEEYSEEDLKAVLETLKQPKGSASGQS